MYDADIKIDNNTTAYLVESIRDGIGLCASNTKPVVIKKSTVSRASKFIAEWLRSVKRIDCLTIRLWAGPYLFRLA